MTDYTDITRSQESCIEWQGWRDQDGYGRIHIETPRGRSSMGAHRRIWEEAHGPIPDGMIICHTCDNPPCVNIDHLFLGTHRDNVLDMQAKGRRGIKGGFGERHGLHKLTWADVEVIRSSSDTGIDLARQFNVHPNTIWKARSYRTWRGR